MRFAWLLSLSLLCLGAGEAAAASPLAWLGFGTPASAVKTHNVSQTSRTPAVFARMAGGTKRMVNNTKNLLTPKKQSAGHVQSHSANKPQAPKQSFFGRLFRPEPTPPPRTVGEWMQLDQVHP
jgi:hypothetical protein